MYKILINAYACSPHTGSEPGMAWNWCIHLAQHCELHIITEGEFRNHIEAAVQNLPQGTNMHFYYNPVSEEVRKMCWNQGDWRFYKHYKIWQSKTYELALEIMGQVKIDIVHQLNMIGFREPGYLWQIAKVPFVWGPIGGLKQFPIAYLNGVDFKTKLTVWLKNYLNLLQLKHSTRVHKALHRAELLISSIPDSERALRQHKNLNSFIIPETGCFEYEEEHSSRFRDKQLKVLWVGKFDFRKQLPLALKMIAATKNKHILLDVYGKGSHQQESDALKLVENLKIKNQIVFKGAQPHESVKNAMKKADLFLFTSVSEDTSTVVMEAISYKLPVLCFDACGFGYVVNDKIGRKVALSSPKKSISDFANQLNALYANRHSLVEMSENCTERQKELSWENKAQQMLGLYKSIMAEPH